MSCAICCGFGSWPGLRSTNAERRDAEAVVVVLPRVMKDDHVAMRRRNGVDLRLDPLREQRRAARCSVAALRRTHSHAPGRRRSGASRIFSTYCLASTGSIQRCGLRSLIGKPSAQTTIVDAGSPASREQSSSHVSRPAPFSTRTSASATRRDVLRRRRERFRRRADRHDVLHRHVLAADALHERVERRDRRDDALLPLLGLAERRAGVRFCALHARTRGRSQRRGCVLLTCAASSEKLHRMAVELESVQRAQRIRRTAPSRRSRRLRRGRTRGRSRDDDGAAGSQSMNVASPSASDARVTVALGEQTVQRAIDGRERDLARERSSRRWISAAERKRGSSRRICEISSRGRWRIRLGSPRTGLFGNDSQILAASAGAGLGTGHAMDPNMLIKPPGERDGATVTLSDSEHKEATRRTALRAAVVFETVRREGEQELERPVASLAFSGLAAGLSMGFSLVSTDLFARHFRRAAGGRSSKISGYTLGFLIVILGRQQLFTAEYGHGDRTAAGRPEQTLYVSVRRAFVDRCPHDECPRVSCFSPWGLAHTDAFAPEVKAAFLELGRQALSDDFLTILVKDIFAGWLIALMVCCFGGGSACVSA